MEVISFLNNKGGVGKTTLCCNMAQSLAISGKKVLCIDNDSQHSLSNRLQVPVREKNMGHLYRDFNGAEDYVPFLEKAVAITAVPKLHCITSPFNLINSDVKSLKAVKDLIEKSEISEFYDFVLIDNHPGVDRLQHAAILASSRFFVPAFLRQQSLEGLGELITFLHRLIIPDKAISIIPNHDEGLKHDKAMLTKLKKMFPHNITRTVIPKDRMIEEVESQGKILFLDRLFTSKSVPYLIKLITELFPDEYDEKELKGKIAAKRSRYVGRRVLANLTGVKTAESSG
ncbi:MAG: AAA family ATPase [Chitinivibrionales bacterium]|nr:AAA family ATPase [Chitinivibrionales bacterium]MBD3356889.1 AAA family ATPase [Chitinivibrionales bacterium]